MYSCESLEHRGAEVEILKEVNKKSNGLAYHALIRKHGYTSAHNTHLSHP